MYDNLEVFVLTYNRASLLKDTLKSICEQNAKGFDLIVLDNASTDNTAAVVAQIAADYPERNVKICTCEQNINATENSYRAKELASKEWLMLFHDDDIMHPDYIKNAMDLLAKTPNAVMASCDYLPLEHPDDKNWENFGPDAYFVDAKGFCALLFGYIMHNFASTIYKTEFFKKYNFDNETYGKIADRPFMFEFSKNGKHVILKDKYIRYRIHPGQDSNTLHTGPFAHEWFALMNLYKSIMTNSWLNKYGITYNAFIHYQLKLGYHWMGAVNTKISYKEFKKQAAQAKVIRSFEKYKLFEFLYKLPRKICTDLFYRNKLEF